MKICDIFTADTVRSEIKKLLSKTKNQPKQKLMFPSKNDTPGHGYRSGSSKRFGQG